MQDDEIMAVLKRMYGDGFRKGVKATIQAFEQRGIVMTTQDQKVFYQQVVEGSGKHGKTIDSQSTALDSRR